MRWRLALCVLVSGAPTCDRAAKGRPSGAEEFDSAGIQIIRNHTPVWDSAEFWTVDPEPVFAIGGYGGASDTASTAQQLVWNIRGAAPLSDGGVAMLSFSGERKVLVFESSGELSASFGRAGQGPGEFSYAFNLQVLPGDTIAVWDAKYGPVGYFDPAGRLLKHRRIDFGTVAKATLATNQVLAESIGLPLLDGSFLVEVERSDWEPPDEGLYQPPVGYVRIDSAYSAHWFGWWADVEMLARNSPPHFVPFARRSIVTGGGNPIFVYVAPGDRYEIHQFSATGILQRIIRRNVDPIRIESGEASEWMDDIVTRNPYHRLDWSAWKRDVARLPTRFHDLIHTFQVDSAGYLWAMENGSDATSEWSVYDLAGRWLGTLSIPLPDVTWIGGDIVVGVQTDATTGVETVEGYRLNRHPARQR